MLQLVRLKQYILMLKESWDFINYELIWRISPFRSFFILTTKGTREYMEKYAETIKRVSGTFGPTPTYSGEALEKIVKTMEAEIPLTGQLKKCN